MYINTHISFPVKYRESGREGGFDMHQPPRADETTEPKRCLTCRVGHHGEWTSAVLISLPCSPYTSDNAIVYRLVSL